MWELVKILRPVNLLMIAVTQSIMYFLIVLPFIETYDFPALLGRFQVILFIMITVLIAAGGNVINDIYDAELDLINKPERTFVGNTISKNGAWWLYILLTIAGAVITIYLGIIAGKQTLVFIYPLAASLLYFYSSHLKFRFLIGNLVVALFTAFVIWIMLLSHDALLQQPDQPATRLLIAFGVFSFFSNLIREIVKDLEDKDGDIQAGAKTMGAILPLKQVKVIIFSLAFLLFSCLIFDSLNYISELYDFRSNIFMGVFLIAPLVLMMLKLSKANDKKSFAAISRFLKMYMLAGLMLCMLLSQNLAHAS